MKKTTKKPKNIFFTTPKWMMVLKSIGNNKNMSQISKDSKVTYSYVMDMKNLFLKHKLITCSKAGRINKLSLTEKGDALYKTLLRMDILLQ